MLNSAIISVYDKTGLKDFLEGLYQINPEIKIFSSGGTARKIDELGYDVIEISSYTGFPESPGGLVKTLHPKVHGGILLDKSRLDERKYLEENGILTFGLVVCNLYPFKEVSSSGAPEEEVVENIDIGGPTLIRSAAKGALRHGGVAPVVDTEDYNMVIEEMKNNNGELTSKTISNLALKAFEITSYYDDNIRKWLYFEGV